MNTIYNIFVFLYHCTIHITAIFNKKAKLWINGRKEWRRIINTSYKTSNKTAWFHSASLGEFEQGRPVLEAFKKKHPNYKIILTFFSPSGYEVRKNYDQADNIYYLPIDKKNNVKWFIDNIKPDIVFFVKYEFWYNYIEYLYKKKIPIYFISVIFRPSQHFFKWYGGWFVKRLKMISHFYVQNNESKSLLESIGIFNCSISGDTRFDRVISVSIQEKKISSINEFINNSPIIIAGSTWDPDEEKLADLLKNNNNYKLIIAPHEIGEKRIKQIQNRFNNSIRYSNCKNINNLSEYNVLIIDTIGLLSYLYKYARISYIGGGFGKGIHNTLEAAVFGAPVIFGPNYKKFPEAKDLIKNKGGFSISTSEELISVVNEIKSGNISGDICREYVYSKAGASNKILNSISFENNDILQTTNN